jgi:hypothetical protein
MATMFRRLSPSGGTPRDISEVVNNVLNGKINSTGTITLATGGATSTTLYDERISTDSKIILLPKSAASLANTAPYGEFQNNTDQTAPSVGSTTVVNWNVTKIASGVTISDTNRINVFNDGLYDVFVALQLQNISNDGQYADVWYRVNGVDVTDSAKRIYLVPRKSGTQPSHVVAVLNILLDLEAGDYVQVAGSVSSTDVSLEHFAADGAIPRPAIPAAIVKVEYMSPLAYSNIYATAQVNGQATIEHFANSTADKTYAYVVLG